MELDQTCSSPTNPMNQRMAVELKWRTVLDGAIIDPVNELGLVDYVSQVTMTGFANFGRSFQDAWFMVRKMFMSGFSA